MATTNPSASFLIKTRARYSFNNSLAEQHPAQNLTVPFAHTADNIIVTINGVPTNNYSYSNSVVRFESGVLSHDDLVTIYRQTTPDAAEPKSDKLPEYNPGDNIRAEDLNEANSILVKRIEELEALVKSQAYLGDNPPDSSLVWPGMAWMNTTTMRVSIFNGKQWVETSPQ